MSGSFQSFDVIVIGVGSMGASACYHLARRGIRVLGLEQFDIPHGLGSYHGHSRMIRLAYFEHPDYVPLLRRSFDLWHELSAELGRDIIHITGGLMMGPPGAEVLEGSIRSVREHALSHELFGAIEARRRYPQFVLPDDYRVLLDHQAGLVLPEAVVAGYAELAMRRGAVLHGCEAVRSWAADEDSVVVRTDRSEYTANRVIFCGGAWTDQLVQDLGVPLTITRQPLAWVWPKQPDLFERGSLPVWIVEHRDGTNHYGFPMLAGQPGVKIATHDKLDVTTVDTLDRTPRSADEAAVRRFLSNVMPAADGPLLSMRICMYTNSPDGHFIVDRHPDHRNVILACGFSGHGFKFASAIGESLSELAVDGRTTQRIGFLGMDRFRQG